MNRTQKIDFPFPELKFVKSKQLRDMDFSYYMLKRLIKENILKRINGDTYENLTYQGDEEEFYYVSAYISNGIVCLMSAAVYYGLSVARPHQIEVAIHQKARINKLPDWPQIKLFYFSDKRYKTGVEIVDLNGGNFHIFDREKVVCDLLVYRHKYGVQEVIAVLKNYLYSDYSNLNKLNAYAKKLRCHAILTTYLEALL